MSRPVWGSVCGRRTLRVSQHLRMNCGVTSAVYAGHRFGNLLAWVILTSARAPLSRSVDDFSELLAVVSLDGGKILDVLGLLSVFLGIRRRRSVTPS